MRRYNQLILIITFLIILIFCFANVTINNSNKDNFREYKVQVERLCADIENNDYDINNYSLITKITISNELTTDFVEGENDDYVIRKINDKFYRIDYQNEDYTSVNFFLLINVLLLIMTIILYGVIFYLRKAIIDKFEKIKDIPQMLSTGNLATPLQESKNKYFGKFVWGLDLLREKLEKQEIEELKLQKEKKTLILSISHDIKTPLSAIKLYSKALSKGLYTDEEKNLAIAQSINEKADEIEAFVSQIIKASREDFLHLEVNNSEFYLNELIDHIKTYYLDKLELNRIKFSISEYDNCLLRGDINRATEVLQNIIENAIKYGDGRYIKITFSSDEGFLLINTINSGNTLSQNEIPHIFESFYRGSNANNANGSGLGLFICRDLMKKMDGDIFAKIINDDISITTVFKIS